jgi:soluble lytic murein transglycosylase-like protein
MMDIPILIAALILVESGGNPKAIGDSGQALGVLQIRPIFVEDVNRILGRNVYYLTDRESADQSVDMVKTWITYYKGRYDAKYLIPAGYREMAIAYNRGYSAMQNMNFIEKDNDPYWLRVKSELESMGVKIDE